jgi:hypothetical protein
MLIDKGNTEWTDKHASLAADTPVLVYHDRAGFQFSMHGAGRAKFEARCFFTLLADNRQGKDTTVIFGPNRTNSGLLRITLMIVMQGTSCFTTSATGTLLQID